MNASLVEDCVLAEDHIVQNWMVLCVMKIASKYRSLVLAYEYHGRSGLCTIL